MLTGGRSRFALAGAVVVWLVAVGTGTALLWDHVFTSGVAAAPPTRWPASSAIVPRAEHGTLLFFAHSHCPCTRASLAELASLVTHAPALDVHVLLLKPPETANDWDRTDIAAAAAAIPGVAVHRDEAGHEAARFHVATSGQAILYDAGGVLRFSGGITAARGHVGDNAGRSAVLAHLGADPTARQETPVFGCALEAEPASRASSTRAAPSASKRASRAPARRMPPRRPLPASPACASWSSTTTRRAARPWSGRFAPGGAFRAGPRVAARRWTS